MQAVLDRISPNPAHALKPMSIDLPAPADVLYPDLGPALFTTPNNSDDAPAPAFVIDSLAKADWAVSRILDAEARNARRAELASLLHARVDQWLNKASASDQESIDNLTALVRPFAEVEIAKQRRSRSLVLPSGTIQLRRLLDRLDITDPEAAMAWATDNAPEAIIVRKELSKSALKTLIFKDGEAVPGIEASLGTDEIYVKASA